MGYLSLYMLHATHVLNHQSLVLYVSGTFHIFWMLPFLSRRRECGSCFHTISWFQTLCVWNRSICGLCLICNICSLCGICALCYLRCPWFLCFAYFFFSNVLYVSCLESPHVLTFDSWNETLCKEGLYVPPVICVYYVLYVFLRWFRVARFTCFIWCTRS